LQIDQALAGVALVGIALAPQRIGQPFIQFDSAPKFNLAAILIRLKAFQPGPDSLEESIRVGREFRLIQACRLRLK
jgi:hypothetical protein